MIDIPAQLLNKCPVCSNSFGNFFVPSGDDAEGKAKDFLPNQIVRCKIAGTKKARSIIQLNLYWKCCEIVADSLDGESKDSIDFSTKVGLKFIKSFRVCNGQTFVEVDSISFKNLSHIVACNYFDRAFPFLAKLIKIDEDTLISEAKSRMKTYGR